MQGDERLRLNMSTYHKLISIMFREEGLITIDGYSDIENKNLFTPSYMFRAPTKEKLKRFEKDIIKRMISLE